MPVNEDTTPPSRQREHRNGLNGSASNDSLSAHIDYDLASQQAEHREGAAWFEHDDLARFVLNSAGHIERANARARTLTALGVMATGEIFIFSHRNRHEFDVLLTRLIEGRQTNGRMLFRSGDDEWCLLALGVLPGLDGKIFATVCQARPLDAQHIAPLQMVFGLTKAETSVLSHLVCGDAPKDIGRKMDMSIHTVRAHLRAIFMRMGVKGITGALRLSLQLTVLSG